LGRIFDIFRRHEMRRQHHALTGLEVPDIRADRVYDADAIGPDRERTGRRIVNRQSSFDKGFQVRHQRRRLDPHQHAAGARLRRGDIAEAEFSAESLQSPGFHERFPLTGLAAALWTPARGEIIMRSPASERSAACTFRHAHHEFPVTIKAVVFDAYGTLYDIQSVAAVTEEAFPGYGELVTQIWRIKQLEYTWLRSLMRRYEDFSVITRDALGYTLRVLGLKHDAASFERIMDKYLHLDLYPDAAATLAALKGRKLAILSNGSPDMLDMLVANSGLDRVLNATISIDSQKFFKPAPEAYSLIESVLGMPPTDVLFVSSNPWDACGARAFGLNVAWIERVTPEAMWLACVKSDLIAPLTMFKAIRTQMDELGIEPDYRIHALSELPDLVARHER
jgi:2-haloacid dehalogenase